MYALQTRLHPVSRYVTPTRAIWILNAVMAVLLLILLVVIA